MRIYPRTYLDFRLYIFIGFLVIASLVCIFSSWLSALFFLGVLLLGGFIALLLRRSEKHSAITVGYSPTFHHGRRYPTVN